jgi:hypothetical protein
VPTAKEAWTARASISDPGFEMLYLCFRHMAELRDSMNLPGVHGWDLQCRIRGILRTAAANNFRLRQHLSGEMKRSSEP